MSFSSRFFAPTWSAIPSSTPKKMSIPAMSQSDRNVVSIWSWNSSPSTTIGMLPMMISHPDARVRVVARDLAEQRLEPARDDAHDVPPEEQDDRRLGSDLRDRRERRARILRARQELAEDAQMSTG